jgi:predicted dehydrogenase
MTRFAAVGLDHRHIYHQVEELIAAGAECAGYWPDTTDPRVLEGFRKRFPQLMPVADRRRLLEDPSIDVICCAAVPRDRASIAVEAMQNGKDVMVDKPGATTMAELDTVRRAVAQTGRIFSICFSERFVVPSMEVVAKLVADSSIGRVVDDRPWAHRLNRAPPDLVFRCRRLWRHTRRHRLAPDRPVPVFDRIA